MPKGASGEGFAGLPEHLQPSNLPYAHAGGSVSCLACGGKGYTAQRDYRGLPYPLRCQACQGTGRQRIAS